MNDKQEPRTVPSDQLQDAATTSLQGPKARQGEMSGRIRKVLIVSTTLAGAAMLGTWWYFAA